MCVVVERHLNDHVLCAAMVVRYETARALVGPFDRPPEQASAVQETDIFGVNRGLHAKRAADLTGDYADLVGWRSKNLHQRGLHAVHALTR